LPERVRVKILKGWLGKALQGTNLEGFKAAQLLIQLFHRAQSITKLAKLQFLLEFLFIQQVDVQQIILFSMNFGVNQ
jgi:hypothetical protein